MDQPTDAQATAYHESLPPLGDPVEYFLYAHCGIETIRLGGEWWRPVTTDGDEDDLGDYERGTLTVTSRSHAQFESDAIEVEYEPGPAPTTLCR